MNKGKKTKDMAECKEISPLANDSEELTPLLRGARLEPWRRRNGAKAMRLKCPSVKRSNEPQNRRAVVPMCR
jgi:hypothetical protein